MDYAGEQSMEMEALEAILMSDLEVVTRGAPGDWEPQGNIYRVELQPVLDDGAPESERPARVEVYFAHTASYPDAPPLLKAAGVQAISDSEVAELEAALAAVVEESLGAPMIYTLLQQAQEWLNERAKLAASVAPDEATLLARERAAEEARIAAVRAHGTPVTVQAFHAWAAAFAREQAAAAGGSAGGKAGGEARLTGRQWFKRQEEAQLPVEEPELELDEEDGEDGRGTWQRRRQEESEEDSGEDSDEDALLEEMAALKGV